MGRPFRGGIALPHRRQSHYRIREGAFSNSETSNPGPQRPCRGTRKSEVRTAEDFIRDLVARIEARRRRCGLVLTVRRRLHAFAGDAHHGVCEDVLASHAAVADVAIVAMPSRETGEKGCAFGVLRPGQKIDLTEIRRFLERAGLARQKCPEHLVLVDDLPGVPSDKV